MRLKPSEIYFSQDSINNVFDKRCAHSYEPIGHTLDALCEGRSRVSEIPTITVVLIDGKWVTADNRRLWVFREMERLGKCDQIPVVEDFSIPAAKMTSYNGGTSVHVRGSPGGSWHNKPSSRNPSASKVSIRSKAARSTHNFSTSTTGILKDQSNILNAYSPTSRRNFASPDATTKTYNTLSNNRVSPVSYRSTSISSNYKANAAVKTSRPSSSTTSVNQYINIRHNSPANAPRRASPRAVSPTVFSPTVYPPNVDWPRTVASHTAAPRVGSGYHTPATTKAPHRASSRVVSPTVDSSRTVSPSVEWPRTVASRTAAPHNGSGYHTPATTKAPHRASSRVVSPTVDSSRTVSPSVEWPRTVASRTAAPHNGSGYPTPVTSYSRTDDWSNRNSRQETITVSPSSRLVSNHSYPSRVTPSILKSSKQVGCCGCVIL